MTDTQIQDTTQTTESAQTQPAQTSQAPAVDKGSSDPTGLRDELKRNFAAAAKKASEERNDEKAGKATQTSGAARGDDGKFVKATNSPVTTTEPQKTETVAQPAAPEAPHSWRGEAKALWPKLMAGQQLTVDEAKIVTAELAKREDDFKRGIMDKDGELKNAKPVLDWFTQVTQPHMQTWQAKGISPQAAVQHFIQLGTNFQRDPGGTIRWLAQTAGLDLSQLAQGTQTGGNTDPQVQSLMQELNGLRTKLGQMETGWHTQHVTAATQEIQTVMDEKDAQGNLVRPHFNDVFQEIQSEMQILRHQHPEWTARQVATAAYDVAVWKNPTTREKLMESKINASRQSEEAKRRETIAAQAAKEPKGGPPNQVNGAPSTDLRGMLSQQVYAHLGGGSRI